MRDLDSPQHIDQFVEAFYSKMLNDALLGHIFLDVAKIDIAKHLPLISLYWQKLLLASKGYTNHTMNIHRDVFTKFSFAEREFERWFELFTATLDENFSGPYSRKARRIAKSIAQNMYAALHQKPLTTLP